MSVKSLLLSIIFLTASLAAAAAGDTAIGRLSPLPTDNEKNIVSLDGKWMFNPRPEANFQRSTATRGWNAVRVPGDWSSAGYDVPGGECAGYRRNLFVPERWQGQRVKLRCDGISSSCTIWVNGRLAARHTGGFTAFEADVTDCVNFGTINEIAISVDGGGAAATASGASMAAGRQIGGIIRSIFLFALPQVNFAMLHAATALDGNYRDATMAVEAEVANESRQPATGLRFECSLLDADGREVAASESPASVGAVKPSATASVRASLAVESPRLWTPESPALYTLVCRLMDGGNVVATSERSIGFREVSTGADGIYLNGQPLRARGVEYRLVRPDRKFALSDDTLRRELAQLREANVNYLNITPVTPDDRLLDMADELGLFVSVAAPLARLSSAMVPDSLRRRVVVGQQLEAVNLLRSHPSVLAWILTADAPGYGDLLCEAASAVRSLDPSRPLVEAVGGEIAGDEITDSLQRPLPAFWDLKKTYSPVRVYLAENVRADGWVTLDVENRGSSVSLSEYSFVWKAGDRKGSVQAPDVEQGSTGRLSILLPAEARGADRLTLTVTDGRGTETDRYSFRLRPETRRVVDDEKGRQPLMFLNKSDSYIVSDGTTTYSVSKTTGLLNVNRGSKNLLSGPRLAGNGATGWVAEKIEARSTREGATITVEGECRQAAGQFVYRFTPDGRLTVSYDFIPLGDEKIDGTAVLFTLDGCFDELEWHRRGRWNCYPADHVAANEGKAKAAYDELTRPSAAWAYDNTPQGSNIFTAPKEHFRRAMLSNGSGVSIAFESDGSQDFCAHVDGSVVRCAISESTASAVRLKGSIAIIIGQR